MVKFLQRPLLQCLIIGGIIAVWQYRIQPLPDIVISQQQIDAARQQLDTTFGKSTDDVSDQQIGTKLADDEMLYQQAREAGFDQLPGVKTRLANVAEFLQIVPPGSSFEERYHAALDMQLDETDIVVRRQMVTLYRTALKNSAKIEKPSVDAIETFYRDNRVKYTQAARYRFSHIYFEDNSEQGHTRAVDVKRRLLENAVPLDKATHLGDVFYGGHSYPLQSAQQTARHLGQQFADQLAELPTGQWSDPVASTFGWHLVFISETTPETLKPLSTVQDNVIRELENQMREQAHTQQLETLRANYRIDIQSASDASSTRQSSAASDVR